MVRALSFCIRNLRRNRRRSALVGSMMAFAVMVMVVSIGLGDGGHVKMIQAATDTFSGHIQIRHPDYSDSPGLDHMLDPRTAAEMVSVAARFNNVIGLSRRIEIGGLIARESGEPAGCRGPHGTVDSVTGQGAKEPGGPREAVDPVTGQALREHAGPQETGNGVTGQGARGCGGPRATGGKCVGAEGVQIVGVDTSTLSTVSTINRSTIGSGRLSGRFLLPDSRQNPAAVPETVLGEGLAGALGVVPGDLVRMSLYSRDKQPINRTFRVVGVVRTPGVEVNRTWALVEYRHAAEMAGAPDWATAIAVRLKDIADSHEIRDAFNVVFDDSGLSAYSAAASSWDELLPEIPMFILLDQGSLLVMLVILVLVIVVILANVVNMSTVERMREFGIRIALGESPRHIAFGVVAETVVLSAMSCAAGALAGVCLNLFFMWNPVDVGFGGGGRLETAGILVDSTFQTVVSFYGTVFSVLTVMALSLLGSVIPAFRIRKLSPTDAVRIN